MSSKTSLQIYISGGIYDKDDSKISVYDHGLYGDGVFEGIRSYGGKVFRLDEHLDRLWNSEGHHTRNPHEQGRYGQGHLRPLAVNKIKDGYIRVVATRGAGSLGLDPTGAAILVIIITDLISLIRTNYTKKAWRSLPSARCGIIRPAPSPRIKSLNYLNNILAKIEGVQAGCIEALMLNCKGEVAECTGDNIFIVRQGRLAHLLRLAMPAFWKALPAT